MEVIPRDAFRLSEVFMRSEGNSVNLRSEGRTMSDLIVQLHKILSILLMQKNEIIAPPERRHDIPNKGRIRVRSVEWYVPEEDRPRIALEVLRHFL